MCVTAAKTQLQGTGDAGGAVPRFCPAWP